jgi:hypothetical protein
MYTLCAHTRRARVAAHLHFLHLQLCVVQVQKLCMCACACKRRLACRYECVVHTPRRPHVHRCAWVCTVHALSAIAARVRRRPYRCVCAQLLNNKDATAATPMPHPMLELPPQ